MRRLVRVDIVVPDQGDLPSGVEAWLSERTAQGWEESIEAGGATRFRVHLEDAPPARNSRPMPSGTGPRRRCPWIPSRKRTGARLDGLFHRPIEVGGVFEIVPPWLADKDTEGRQHHLYRTQKWLSAPVHHATTALCLAAFADLVAAGRIGPGHRFLDLGTGSGILGIGLCRLGLTGVGLDIDPQAVWCAVENVRRNGVEAGMQLAVGGAGCLTRSALFDLVVANILAAPLTVMAGKLVRHLVPGGVLVLSGILIEQAAGVAAAYQALGLPEPEVRESGEWAALVWPCVYKASDPV